MFDEIDEFEKLQAERREIDALLERGVKFQTPKRGLFGIFSKSKQRNWVIKEPYLGALDIMSRYLVQMEINETEMAQEPLVESKAMVIKNAKLASKAIAVAILNNKWKIKFFTKSLAKYLYWHLKPSKLLQLAKLLNTMGNYMDFTISIKLISGSRITKPKEPETLIEKKINPDEEQEL